MRWANPTGSLLREYVLCLQQPTYIICDILVTSLSFPLSCWSLMAQLWCAFPLSPPQPEAPFSLLSQVAASALSCLFPSTPFPLRASLTPLVVVSLCPS